MLMLLNGQLMEEKHAVLSVLDHGFLYGVGAFETFRTYRGEPFLLEDHMVRLGRACERMKIMLNVSLSEWEKRIQQLLYANHMNDAMIRVMVTGGTKEIGLGDVNYRSPNSMIFLRSLPPIDLRGRGLAVVTTPRQSAGGVEQLKTNNYLNHVIARQEIADFPQTEGLFLTPAGWVAEGITSNVFFISHGALHTPELELGILPGITRECVMMLARSLGIRVYEGRYLLADLDQSEGVFITSSVQGIVPIHTFQDKMISTQSSLMEKLIKQYQQQTESR